MCMTQLKCVCNELQVACDVVTECVIGTESGFACNVCVSTYNITSSNIISWEELGLGDMMHLL